MQELADETGNSGTGDASTQPQQQPAQPHGAGAGNELGGDGGSIAAGFTADGDRNLGGNRWLRQETLALIQIRSDMDAAFRDSNLKAPIWDEVSRKLSELGFHRSALKCKEKFENVYKYHKRTKDGRTSKSEGKIYRFSDQLEALEPHPLPPTPPPPAAMKPPPVLVPIPNNNVATVTATTVPLIGSHFDATGSHPGNVSPISVAPPTVNHKRSFPFSQHDTFGSTSSYTSSDDEPPKRKRKWEAFFEGLMKEVLKKQEELQTKFLETLERHDRIRTAREEAWRAEEIARANREYDLLAQERSVTAAKDTTVITFLQKINEKNPNPNQEPTTKTSNSYTLPPAAAEPTTKTNNSYTLPPSVEPTTKTNNSYTIPPVAEGVPTPAPAPASAPTPTPVPPPTTPPVVASVDNVDGGGGNILSPTPSRWPKAEINALIHLRTTLNIEYHENGPKGSLWEEISAAMKKLGYNRNAKRCKEKWENINKYYKKVKEGSKKRSEDSKTCSYFDQLDAIYRQKDNKQQITPIVAQPEQQWPPPAAIVEVQPQRQWSTDLGFSVKSETRVAPVEAPVDRKQWLPAAPAVGQGKESPAAIGNNGCQ